MHNQHALPRLFYTQKRKKEKKKTQMPWENCLSSGNIDRPLITIARPRSLMPQLNSQAEPNNAGDGEGCSGKHGGSRLSRSLNPPECPPTAVPLPLLGGTSVSPTQAAWDSCRKVRQSPRGPFSMDPAPTPPPPGTPRYYRDKERLSSGPYCPLLEIRQWLSMPLGKNPKS